jgi:hypothetical protein
VIALLERCWVRKFPNSNYAKRAEKSRVLQDVKRPAHVGPELPLTSRSRTAQRVEPGQPLNLSKMNEAAQSGQWRSTQSLII